MVINYKYPKSIASKQKNNLHILFNLPYCIFSEKYPGGKCKYYI